MARANSAVRRAMEKNICIFDKRVRRMTAFPSMRAEHRAQTRVSQVSQDDDIAGAADSILDVRKAGPS